MNHLASRQQRRAVARHMAEAERAIDADRKFFERFPTRRYRIRRLGRAETEQLEAAMGGVIFTAPGEAPFVLIKNLAPGIRLRTLLPGPADEDGSNASDAELAALWQRKAAKSPNIAARERDMLAVMRPPGNRLHDGGAA